MYNPNYNQGGPPPRPPQSPLTPGTIPSLRDIYDTAILLTNAIAGLNNVLAVELPSLRQQIATLNANMSVYEKQAADITRAMNQVNINANNIVNSLNENAQLLRTLGQE